MMLLHPLSGSSLCNHRRLLSVRTPNSYQARASRRLSFRHQTVREPQLLGSLAYNPFRSLEMSKKRRVVGAVCSSALLTPRNLQWASTVCAAVLMLARGTAIHKSFLVPIFALQAPANLISWMKGEYGIWTAFLALLVRLFFHIPGELELPFITLLLVIVSPYQIMRLRGTQEGISISLAIAIYLAFQHFNRVGSLGKAFDQGSILATLAIICVIAIPCLLLI